ncbi:hypothetical protein [Stappia sp. ICDLI1TA098]
MLSKTHGVLEKPHPMLYRGRLDCLDALLETACATFKLGSLGGKARLGCRLTGVEVGNESFQRFQTGKEAGDFYGRIGC